MSRRNVIDASWANMPTEMPSMSSFKRTETELTFHS